MKVLNWILLTFFLFLLFAALSACADEGFFSNPAARAPKVATGCAILVRYNQGAPGLEISYVNGGPCALGDEEAISAAQRQVPPVAKVVVYGELAHPPSYQCSINITWVSGAPSAASAQGAGMGCDHAVALAKAAQAAACMHHDVPCVVVGS